MPKKAADKSVSNKSFDEKLFRLLVAQVKDHAIFMIDPNGYILSWNQGAEHIIGYTEEEIIGKHISVFYSVDDIQNEPRANMNEALKNGMCGVEGWRVKKDLSIFWANIVLTPLYNDEGHLTGFGKVIRDITEQKEINDRKTRLNAQLKQQVFENTEKIAANEQRFKQLIENSYDGISLMDENLKVIFRSKSSQRINGWTNTERDLLSIIDLAHPDDKELLKKLIGDILNNPGIPVISTYRSRHKLGHYIWIECVYTNMLNDVNINAIVCNFRDVTGKKAADEEVRKKTGQLENILESITEGFIALDKNFCYTYVNNKIGEMLSLPPESLLGKYIWSEFPEAVNSETFKTFNQALKEQRYVYSEDYLASKNLWYENHIYPAADGGLSVFIRDITERKLAEAEIQKNHIQLLEASATQAAILNALPPNIVLINEKGKIIAVNESWKKFTLDINLGLPQFGIGYSYLAIAETATDVDKATNNKIARGIKDIIVGNKKEFKLEYATHISNEKIWYQVIIAPLDDTNHKGAVILHIDITDRKLAEEALIQSEANLRSVFENTDLIIVLFDNDLNIVSFNTNAKKHGQINFGKKLKIGASAYNYFPKERKALIQQIVQKVSTCKETVCYETTYIINEVLVWYEVKWICVVNKDNESIGVILTLNNITEKKNADLERDKMTADLVQRNKDLEQFTYIVSHNLRAPVANIRGLSNLLNGFGADDEADNAAALQALSYSINDLDKVIIDLNNILQIGKQVNDQIETVSLPDLVEEIKSGIHEMIRKNKASIVYDFEELDELNTLKVYMYSIFQNLVINSIKFKRPGVRPQIEISSAVVDKSILLRFKDNGKGIDLAKNSPHLFGLYKRFDTSVEGKGMGLFIVKLQTESLGGTINVNSEVNNGTEFLLEFPIKLKNNKIVPDAKL